MLRNLRKLENLHIPLWLIKDTCWMLVWRPLGIAMMIPTISIAFIIAWKTRKMVDLYINLAICFWIVANSYWMCVEFFHFENLKEYALIPFLIGIAFTGIFFLKTKGETTVWYGSEGKES